MADSSKNSHILNIIVFISSFLGTGDFVTHSLRGGLTKYKDLSEEDFTGKDQEKIVNLYNEKIKVNPHLSVETFASWFSLNAVTVRMWILRFRRRGRLMGKRGPPSRIDDEGVDYVLQEVKQYRKTNHEPPNRAQVSTILKTAADATSTRRGTQKAALSYRLVSSYIKRLDLRARVPQVITPARDRACSDPRMIYSTMIMVNALVAGLPPEVIWNWDATTFIIPTPGAEQVVYVVKDDELLIPPAVVTEDPLPFAIKWLQLADAAGSTAPMLLIIGVADIPKDEAQMYSLFGLNYTGDPRAEGYIIFCKTRAAFDEVYRWFMEEHVIPLINDIRKLSCLTDDDGEPLPGVVSCDGEQMVLDEVFNTDVLDAFQEHNIHVGKISASCSAILQPLDRSPVFKAAKSRLKSIVNADDAWTNLTLKNNILNVLQRLEKKFDISIANAMKERIAYGILAVRQALNETVTMRTTRDGFRDTGWYPLSLNTMMDLCYNPIPEDLRETMLENIKEDSELFLSQGYLTEEQYEESGIPTIDNPESLPRDERALPHQRAALLTHPTVVLKRNTRMSTDLAVNEVLNSSSSSKSEKRQLLTAVKKVQTHDAGVKRKREQDEAKKNRTQAEIEEEKQAKKQKTETRKQNEAKALEDARALIANYTDPTRGC